MLVYYSDGFAVNVSLLQRAPMLAGLHRHGCTSLLFLLSMLVHYSDGFAVNDLMSNDIV